MSAFLDPSPPPSQQDKEPSPQPRTADPAGLPCGRAPAGWVHLDSVDRNVVAPAAVASPLLGHLLTEDLCWAIAYADWAGRSPTGRNGRAAWLQEGEALESKRQRVVEMAAAFGITPAQPTRTSWLVRLRQWLRPASS